MVYLRVPPNEVEVMWVLPKESSILGLNQRSKKELEIGDRLETSFQNPPLSVSGDR